MPAREYTAVTPFTIQAIGENIIDWSMHGGVGGSGIGVNKCWGGLEDAYYDPETGERSDTPVPLGYETWHATKELLYVKPNTLYTFKNIQSRDLASAVPKNVLEYDENGDFITAQGAPDKWWYVYQATFRTSENTHMIRLQTAYNGDISGHIQYTDVDFMLNEGEEILPYEAAVLGMTLTVTGASDSSTISISLDQPLGPEDTISMTSTGLTIPTYFGANTITTDSYDSQPTMYVKYMGGEVYAAERPEQIDIYDISEPQLGFNHNGIAILMPSDVTSMKEDKGRWDITMKHPVDVYGKWTYIAAQNIIKLHGQLFRIDQVEINADKDKEYVQAHANHITYDLKDWWIEEAKFSTNTGNDYIAQLFSHRIHDFPNQQAVVGEYSFDVTSNLSKSMKADLKDQSYIEALYGADSSLAVRYEGEVYRNNFHVSINSTMEGAPAKAFAIRYGTDLTKISFKIDYSNWITNLVCVDNLGGLWATWYGGSVLPHHHKTKRVHFTYEALDSPEAEMQRLIADGEAYWATVSAPAVSVEVNVANIKNDPKYADFLNLQNFDVGYKGTIYVEHLGINVEMKINSIKRNELTGEGITIKLGSTQRSLIRATVLSGTIVSPNSVEGTNVANNQALESEIEDTQTIIMAESIEKMELFKVSDLEKRTITELEGN